MGGHSYHSNYSGGRRVHYGSGGGGGGDCSGTTLVTYGITFLVTLLIVYIIVISIKFPKASDKETSFSLSETRIIKIESTWFNKFSLGPVSFKDVTFNTTYQNDAYGQDVHLLRFKKRPPLTKSDTWNLTEPEVPIIDKSFYYWSWYLYAGSTIQITWNYDVPITVYVVKGTAGYNAYDADAANFYKFIEIQFDNKNKTFTQAISKDDIYFVIFENYKAGSPAQGSAFFTLNSKLLDVSNPDFNCTLPCTHPVKSGASDVFVVTTPFVSEYQRAGKGSPNSELVTRFRKYSRVGFIVGVVYLLPILTPIVIIVLAILLYVYRDELGDMCTRSSSSPAKFSSSSSTPSEVPMSTITISSPSHAEPSSPTLYPTPGAVVDPYPLPPASPAAPPFAPLSHPNPFDSPQLAPPPFNPDAPPPSAPPASDPYPPPPSSDPYPPPPTNPDYPAGEAPPPS